MGPSPLHATPVRPPIAGSLLVSIVIPTYNESKNLPILLEEIYRTLAPFPFIDAEVIIVDDNSPDGTGATADRLARKYPVQVLHRAGKFGLGSAVMEGFRLSKRDFLGVMDGDLSHDPAALPEMLTKVEHHDIVIGSRFSRNSHMEGKWPFFRKLSSLSGVFLAKMITDVRDPLSGFFFTKRNVIERIELTSPGYKILFEILVKGRYSTLCEVPFVFRSRKHSTSKLGIGEYFLFMKQLILLGGGKTGRSRADGGRIEDGAREYAPDFSS